MELFKKILKGKLFGHPIHMMLVHFPASLFPVSAALSLVSYYLKDNMISLLDFYTMCIGAGIGWLALIFGIIELSIIPAQEKSESFRTGLIHGGLNSLWLIFFTVIAGVKFKYYPEIPIPSLVEVLIEIVIVIGMIYSNYLGGELVLRYGVGKKSID